MSELQKHYKSGRFHGQVQKLTHIKGLVKGLRVIARVVIARVRIRACACVCVLAVAQRRITGGICIIEKPCHSQIFQSENIISARDVGKNFALSFEYTTKTFHRIPPSSITCHGFH